MTFVEMDPFTRSSIPAQNAYTFSELKWQTFALFWFANAVEKNTKTLATALTLQKAALSNRLAILTFKTQRESQRWWENIVLASFTEQDWRFELSAGASNMFM